MKRQAIMAMQLAFACMFLLSLNGCLKDNCTKTYTLYRPIYATLAETRAKMHSAAPRPIEQPGKLYIYGNYIFLNDYDKGIHVIDNSQPSAPKQISFISIPGNVDLAVKGNTLYADSYGDLVTFDISNPKQVVAKKFTNSVFSHRAQYYIQNGNSFDPDSIKLVVGWTSKDTTVDCSYYEMNFAMFYSSFAADASGAFAAPKMGGTGGSMARFTIMNDYLYTVTTATLKVFDISIQQEPELKNEINVGWNIETIYPFKDRLFLGSMSGMFIFDVSNREDPVKKGTFVHANACDPVIADDKYAYVTLRSGSPCMDFTNQLEIVNVTSIESPTIEKVYQMTNPHGLSKDGNLLFICDGDAGLKVFDASNVRDIKMVKQVSGLETYDVIAWNKIALVVAKDGLYQFDYTDPKDIRLISSIKLQKP